MSRISLPEFQGMIFVATTPGITSLAAPTVAELTANGTTILDLIGANNGEALVAGSVTGLTTTPSSIETPDYVSKTVGKIPGSTSVDDITMDFYLDDTTNVIKSNLDVGDTGFLAIFEGDQTPLAGYPVDVWPVEVQQKIKNFTGANEAATWKLSLQAGVPTFDGTIAA